MFNQRKKFLIRLELITVAFLLAFTLGGLNTNLLVILLESSKILTGLGKFSFLHTFSDVPVHEGTLGVHQVKFVIDAREDLSDGGGIGDHAHGTHDLSQITTRDDGWWLVVDTALETSRGPVNELDGTLGLDGRDCRVHILWDNITTVHHAARHVLTVTWVTLYHHGRWFEDAIGDLR